MNYLRIQIIFTLVALLALLGCNGGDEATVSDPTVPVTLAPVTHGQFVLPVYTSGRLSIGDEMRLSFKTGGVFEGYQTEEGERVTKGQVLASLVLSEISAQVDMATSSLEKARRDFRRVRNLYEDSVATLEQLQNSETAINVARAQYQVAKFNLDHSVIMAPTDGIVLKQTAESNELVGAGTPIVLFGTTSNDWTVNTGVADRDVVRLVIGDTAQVIFDAYPKAGVKGRVSEIAESPSPATGTYEVKIALDRQDSRLLSGFSAKVTIFPHPEPSSFLVPVDAVVQSDQHGASVYTVSDQNTAKRIDVNIAHLLDDRVAISGGLDGVSTVITRGVEYLADGKPIKVVGDQSTGSEPEPEG